MTSPTGSSPRSADIALDKAQVGITSDVQLYCGIND